MKLILLSGGSGKRLWPLSNDSRSKQFLRVLENDSGKKESMLERVWSQLKVSGLQKDTIIATSEAQKELINIQVGENIPLVIEPERRDTFAAIALSTVYLYSEQKVDLNEVITILPVDPYVDNEYFKKVKELETIVSNSNIDMALIGVKPTYPSSKYGYISINAQLQKNVYSIKNFIEKPSEEDAEGLILNNALWNTGVFAFKLKYIIEYLKENDYSLDYKDLKENYNLLPKNSFDYEFVEKANNLAVLEYSGEWKDLGTWNTLTEEIDSKLTGRGSISNDSVNTHLINELDIPVTVIGVNNTVVIVSSDGVLVSEKKSSARIKEMTLNNDFPRMYEERLWGWSRTLDYTKKDDKEIITKRIKIENEKNSTYHFHKSRNEVWTIISGKGEVVLDERLFEVGVGDVVKIPSSIKHAIKGKEDLEFIEVQTGNQINNNDIYRLLYEWKEIIK